MSTVTGMDVKLALNLIVESCHAASVKSGWWNGIDVRAKHVIPAKLCLIHSEISEAMEGDRKCLMDDHLPHRKMFEVELADAAIRIFDLAGACGLDLGGAIEEKLAYNQKQIDHTIEKRNADGGKKY